MANKKKNGKVCQIETNLESLDLYERHIQEKLYNGLTIASLRMSLFRMTTERDAYRRTLEEIASQDPEMVGCKHKNPCDNSCAMLYSARLHSKKKHTGCAKGLAQRVIDYFDGKDKFKDGNRK